MNSRQEAKLSMYRTVQKHCDANAPITTTNAAFTAAYSDFNGLITALQGSESVVSNQTKGVALDKGSLRIELCKSATDLSALVFAYATKTNNQTLQQKVNYSVSDFKRIKDELLVPACQNIHDAANTNVAALADYGVTVSSVTAFKNAMNIYSAAAPSPQTAKANKVTENANIKSNIKNTDTLLKNEMDKLVVNFKAPSPNFVSTYFNVRVIIDPKTGKPFPKKKVVVKPI